MSPIFSKIKFSKVFFFFNPGAEDKSADIFSSISHLKIMIKNLTIFLFNLFIYLSIFFS